MGTLGEPDRAILHAILTLLDEAGVVLYPARPHILLMCAPGAMTGDLRLMIQTYKELLLQNIPTYHPCILCFDQDSEVPEKVLLCWDVLIDEVLQAIGDDDEGARMGILCSHPYKMVSSGVICIAADLDEPRLEALDTHRPLIQEGILRLTGEDLVPIFGTIKSGVFHPECIVRRAPIFSEVRIPGRIPTQIGESA